MAGISSFNSHELISKAIIHRPLLPSHPLHRLLPGGNSAPRFLDERPGIRYHERMPHVVRVCLMPLRVEARNPALNFLRFQQRLEEVARFRPDIVCLPECAWSGYLYEEKDFEAFAEPIPSPRTQAVSALARKYHCHICFGMLERAPEGVYSSALWIERNGEIALHYRKISEGPPFQRGSEVKHVTVDAGRFAVILCGDLFDEKIQAKIERDVDALLVPLARSFDGKSPDLERWLREERQAYAEAVRKIGVMGWLVNLLEDSSIPEAAFGGAMIIGRDGEILAESAHGTDEPLIYDLVVSSQWL
jgi:predicted amidohydrolase